MSTIIEDFENIEHLQHFEESYHTKTLSVRKTSYLIIPILDRFYFTSMTTPFNGDFCSISIEAGTVK
jgi:hypothetical protein